MKRLITLGVGLMVMLCCTLLPAQEKQPVVIIQKVTQEDGSTSVSKKRISADQDLKTYLQSLEEINGKNYEIHITNEEGSNVKIKGNAIDTDGETVFLFRKSKEEVLSNKKNLNEELEELRIILHDSNEQHQRFEGQKNQGHRRVVENANARPLLGVYVDHGGDVEGLQLSGVVSGKGSAAAGLERGDVVTSVDGQQVGAVRDLHQVLEQHQAGDEVPVTYTRDGQTFQTNVVLSEGRRSYHYSYERDPCKVFIGVYTTGRGAAGDGVKVTGVIESTPAYESDVRRGDIIMQLDGAAVNTFNELLVERNKHEPGDWFTLNIERDGQMMDIKAQFPSCEETTEVAEEVIEEEEVAIIVEETVEPSAIVEVPEEVEAAPELELTGLALELARYNAYPNPTYGQLTVEFQAEALPTNVQVFDATGRMLFMDSQTNFDGYYNKTLNIENGTPGVVFITIRQGDQQVTKKVTLLARV